MVNLTYITQNENKKNCLQEVYDKKKIAGIYSTNLSFQEFLSFTQLIISYTKYLYKALGI